MRVDVNDLVARPPTSCARKTSSTRWSSLELGEGLPRSRPIPGRSQQPVPERRGAMIEKRTPAKITVTSGWQSRRDLASRSGDNGGHEPRDRREIFEPRSRRSRPATASDSRPVTGSPPRTAAHLGRQRSRSRRSVLSRPSRGRTGGLVGRHEGRQRVERIEFRWDALSWARSWASRARST